MYHLLQFHLAAVNRIVTDECPWHNSLIFIQMNFYRSHRHFVSAPSGHHIQRTMVSSSNQYPMVNSADLVRLCFFVSFPGRKKNIFINFSKLFGMECLV